MPRVLALFLLAPTLWGCPQSKAPPAPTSRLTFGITAEPDSLCPLFSEGAPAAEVQGLLFRELVQRDASWRLVPDLADKVPVLGQDAVIVDQKLRVHWRIKADARWSDNTPVSADDFLAALALMRDPRAEITAGRDIVDKLEALFPDADRRGFTAVWREVYPGFAEPRVHRALPAHLVTGKELKRDPFCRHPIGNGPFSLVDWVPGQHLRFARNRAFVPRPHLDEVLVRIMPSTDVLASALRSGEVDATFAVAGLSPLEAQRVVQDAPDRLVAHRGRGNLWVHMDFNLDDPWLKDIRLRRAIALAIDRQGLLRGIFGDAYVVADSYLPTWHPHYSPTPPLPFDPQQARRLLDDAGWLLPPGGSVRENARGERLALQLAAASGQKDSEQLLALVQAALGDVGIEVSLDLKPFKVFFGENARRRKLPHLAFYGWNIDPGIAGGNLWRKDRIPSADNGFVGQNLPGWRDDEVTRWLLEADATLDEGIRRARIAAVQARFADALPAVPFYFRPPIVVAQRGVTGLLPTGTLTPLAFGAATWSRTYTSPLR